MTNEPAPITPQQFAAGKAGYVASLKECPTYLDGTPRPSWSGLSERAKAAWALSPLHGDYFFPRRS